ncbi:MAG TPA: amino acid adenylation domain-containing protein, partial [Gordonia sp. (in: high G+C Gram-positive bacteria)]|nr:amino acid adenylation domain-containing protein [Gordonia sp. (in: high G+C Gram-positive bacteria)]
AVGERIDAVAREAGVTPFMVVHAALSVLLARLSASDDIAVATPVAGRGQSALDPLVGMFVNTLVLRTRVAAAAPFTEILEQAKSADLDAFSHADIPFEAVVEAVDPVRSEAFSPLAQVMLSFDPGASVAEAEVAVAGLSIAPVAAPVVPAQLDLSFIVSSAPAGQDWAGTIISATDLFDESTVAVFADRLVRILDGLTARPTLPVGDVAWVPGEVIDGALTRSRGTDVVLPGESVVDLVSAQTARSRRGSALWFGGRGVSYAEFGARVNALARELISQGVGPNVAVGVAIDRSVELLVAIHAVVAAGGQYVPIATDAPADRVRYMLETAGVSLVLVADAESHVVSRLVADAPRTSTGGGAAAHSSSGVGGVTDSLVEVRGTSLETARAENVRTLVVTCEGAADLTVAPVTDADRIASLSRDDAAYTLFTSGSTGRPKGVTVSHRALMNRLEWMRDWYGLGRADTFVQKTPITFDVSVWELFLPFMIGAELVVAEPGRHGDADYLAELIGQRQISVMHFVPSMLAAYVDALGDERLAGLTSLRVVFTSGEALTVPPSQVLLSALPAVRLVNLYGPTEAAVDVTAYEVGRGDTVIPIGVPVPNTSTLVLDSRLRPVPPGVPGELYLGGVQVARGYAGQSRLTAERFVADPYGAAGARLYRTGDLVKWNGAGVIEYLGRTDFQVKLRGQRLELGEVEAVLAQVPGVVHAAAAVVKTGSGAEHLVGYLVPADVPVDAVKSVVAQKVPEYMVPTSWVLLDEVPLSAAGKLDRRALPAPDFAGAGDEFVAPDGADEELLAAVVAGLLGHDRVGVTDSFFALGGNSLSA